MPHGQRIAPALPLEIIELVLADSCDADIVSFVTVCRSWWRVGGHLALQKYNITVPHDTINGCSPTASRRNAIERFPGNVKSLIIRERETDLSCIVPSDRLGRAKLLRRENRWSVNKLLPQAVLEGVRYLELRPVLTPYDLPQTDDDVQFLVDGWAFLATSLALKYSPRLAEIKLAINWRSTCEPDNARENVQRVADAIRRGILLTSPSASSVVTFTSLWRPNTIESVLLTRAYLKHFQAAFARTTTVNLRESWCTSSQDATWLNNPYLPSTSKLTIVVRNYAAKALSPHRINLAAHCPHLTSLHIVAPAQNDESPFQDLVALTNLRELTYHGLIQLENRRRQPLPQFLPSLPYSAGPPDLCDDYWLRMTCRMASYPPRLEVARFKMGWRWHYLVRPVRAEGRFMTWKKVGEEMKEGFPEEMERCSDLLWAEIGERVDVSGSMLPRNYLGNLVGVKGWGWFEEEGEEQGDCM